MSDTGDLTTLVNVVEDLSRIVIHVSGRFGSTAHAVRELIELGITPVRVAALLGIEPKQVHAELAKAKKRSTRTSQRGGGRTKRRGRS